MDNLSNALYMAFSVFVFILALAVSLLLFRKADETAKVLLYSNSKNAFMAKLDLEKVIEKESENQVGTKKDLLTTRYVTKDAIIPVLYRYMVETICVKIYDGSVDLDHLDQMFFSAFEKDIEKYKENVFIKDNGNKGNTIENPFNKKYYETFCVKSTQNPKKAYMYDAPWKYSQADSQQRVEYYINGVKGFINGTQVDYSNSLIAKDDGTGLYKEIIIQYPYDGVVKQDLDYIENQVYLENEVIGEKVGSKNMEIIYIKQ